MPPSPRNATPSIVRSHPIGKFSATSGIPRGNPTMAKTVLVSGADGFVGRHVVSALTRAGWQVRRCPAVGLPDEPERRHCNGPRTRAHDRLAGRTSVMSVFKPLCPKLISRVS